MAVHFHSQPASSPQETFAQPPRRGKNCPISNAVQPPVPLKSRAMQRSRRGNPQPRLYHCPNSGPTDVFPAAAGIQSPGFSIVATADPPPSFPPQRESRAPAFPSSQRRTHPRLSRRSGNPEPFPSFSYVQEHRNGSAWHGQMGVGTRKRFWISPAASITRSDDKALR